MFKPPGTEHLKVNICELLSNFAFKLRLAPLHLGKRNLFHADLMHTELVSEDEREAVEFPPWIMREARGVYCERAIDRR